ncbi:MAG TPA: prepilin-type N-terminal cleavage/methylation domain-containing protein [Smithella sp.]|nr:prepilin-type N-terminal cleavage/methylation domain-containing protein [Smithella sp.]
MLNNKGFTIVEILTALVVGTIVMAAVYAVINLSQKSSAGIERRVAAQQDQKAALELMAMEIAMASYDPTRAVSWVNSTCNGAAAAGASGQFNKGIQEATANAITIQMDINDDSEILNTNSLPTTDPVDTNEIIRYDYASNIYIRRNVNCNGAQAFLGDSDARKRAVRVINNALNVPLFRYFDGQGNELAAPINIPNIRRILITLAVETENPDPTTGQRRRLVYSTSAIVRNHAPVL